MRPSRDLFFLPPPPNQKNVFHRAEFSPDCQSYLGTKRHLRDLSYRVYKTMQHRLPQQRSLASLKVNFTAEVVQNVLSRLVHIDRTVLFTLLGPNEQTKSNYPVPSSAHLRAGPLQWFCIRAAEQNSTRTRFCFTLQVNAHRPISERHYVKKQKKNLT